MFLSRRGATPPFSRRLFVAAHVGVKSWQYFHYKKVESQLDAQIAETFQQALPGAPVPDPLEARRQVEQILGQLRGTGPTSGMLTTLAMLSEAMAQAPNTDIEALSLSEQLSRICACSRRRSTRSIASGKWPANAA